MSKKRKKRRRDEDNDEVVAKGIYIVFYHPYETISRIGTYSTDDVKKFGNYRFFGKVVEDRGYEYLVRYKYRYPNMHHTARGRLNVPKGWHVVQVIDYDNPLKRQLRS